MLAWTVLSVGYIIYMFAAGGNPEVKRFRYECIAQRLQAIGQPNFSDLSEQLQIDIVRFCERALERFLATKQ